MPLLFSYGTLQQPEVQRATYGRPHRRDALAGAGLALPRYSRHFQRMRSDLPDLATETVTLGDDDRLRAILEEICRVSGMGFAAVARVTETRWIACQVEDRIDFGLDPGGELKISETICDEIRDSGEAIVFDDASTDIKWSRHPVPVIYGFKSYCSFPIYLEDGSFFGTLCAIDPQPRHVSDEAILALFTDFAARVGRLLSAKMASGGTEAGPRAA